MALVIKGRDIFLSLCRDIVPPSYTETFSLYAAYAETSFRTSYAEAFSRRSVGCR